MADRRPLTAALVTVGVLVLSGCAGIPTSGPVHTGAAVVVGQDQPVTQSIAQPPRPGADPQHIVQGFIFSSASFDSDHAVARQYLTPDVAKSWNPAAGTRIYQIGPTTGGYKQVAPNEVDLAATQLGEISPQGEYTVARDDATVSVSFKLRKVAGEWRISNPPPGLLITAADRDRVYRAFNVYFPDPTSRVLVPNQILVPVGPGTFTSLVHAVIAGPTSWLAPALHTAVPTGTKLFPDSAPVVNGFVQIQLTSTAAASSPPDPVTMSAQFVWTLRQLHGLGVNGVAITVGGIPLHIPGVDATHQSWDSFPQFDPDGQIPNPTPSAVYATDKGVSLLNAVGGKPLPGPLGEGPLVLKRPGLSFDERFVAAVDRLGHKLYVTPVTTGIKAPTPVIATATALTAPSWDRFGDVWTVDQQAKGAVVWLDQPGSPPRQVAAPGLPAGKVLALRVARDGVRAVLVVQKPGGSTAGVYLARIEQRGDPQMSLSGFRPLSTPLADVTDVAWFSSDRLAVLGRQTVGGAQEPLTVDLSGSLVSTLGPISSASSSTTVIVSVTAAPSQEILVSTSDDKIYRYVGSGWALITSGSAPSYPG